MTTNTPAGEELKACPFCGGEAQYFPALMYVSCRNCSACSTYGVQGKAVAAWNRRPAPDPAPQQGEDHSALIARIEYILDPTRSTKDRMRSRASLTNHDLRTCLAALYPTPRDAPQQGEAVRRAIALVRRIAAREPWQAHSRKNGTTWEDEAAEIVADLQSEAASARISGERPATPAALAASRDAEELRRMLGALGRLLQFGSLLEDCTTDPEQKFAIRYNVGLLKSAFASLSSPGPATPAQDEVERVARALYACEKARSDKVDAMFAAMKKSQVKFRMEHWDDVADLYRSDARAAIAALSPPPVAASEPVAWLGPIPCDGAKPAWVPDDVIVMVAFNPLNAQNAMTWEFAEKRKAPAKDRDWEAATAFCLRTPLYALSRQPEGEGK